MTSSILLAIDSGLLVLIWLVQLVIYPGFHEIDQARFPKWHARYSFRVSFVVIPLMFGQLGVSVFQVTREWSLVAALHLACVVVAWIATFLVAVPLHRQLGEEGKNSGAIDKLIRCNTLRTAAWTVAWIISVIAVAFTR